MKGLIYNLLETVAHRADCSEEAWELVAEFAAAESILAESRLVRGRETPQLAEARYFEAPAMTMLSCLTMRTAGALDACAEDVGDWSDLEYAALPETYDALPAHPTAGFGPQAFTNAEGDEYEPDLLEFSPDEELEFDDFDTLPFETITPKPH